MIGNLASNAVLTEMPESGGNFFSGQAAYDYSHLLDDAHKKAGYRLYVDHSDFGQLSAHLFHPTGYAGGVDGKMNGTDLHLDGAQIMPLHRGQGFGAPLYEALVAHAANKFNAARWVGGEHSTAAHKLHERLTAKHGFTYEGGAPNPSTANDPIKDFDKKFGSYAVALKSEIEAAEEVLAKVLPTPTFPKLGMPDNRRETKAINTPTEEKGMQRVLGNMTPQKTSTGKKFPMKTRREVGEEVYEGQGEGPKKGAAGGTYTDANGRGTTVSYARPGFNNQRATMMHEDTHRMFQRVEDQYGMQARQNLARNMMDALPKAFQQIVRNHGRLAGQTNIPDEESIGYVISYINSPEHRQMFHAKHDPQRAKVYGSVMKRVYKHLQGVAGVVNENWLGDKSPWSR